jgi:hypothetical protein
MPSTRLLRDLRTLTTGCVNELESSRDRAGRDGAGAGLTSQASSLRAASAGDPHDLCFLTRWYTVWLNVYMYTHAPGARDPLTPWPDHLYRKTLMY